MAGLRLLVALCLLFTITAADKEDWKLKTQPYKQKCAKILSTPKESLEKYMRSEYPEEHEAYCFFRCVMILDESYDDATGPVLEKMFGYIGDGMSLEAFQEYYGSCWNEGNDVHGDMKEPCICWKAYRKHKCLYEKYNERQQAKTGE